MSVENTIREKLTAQFQPHVLNIENESHMHSSGRGSESHFKVTLVTSHFENMRTVARHRAIYSCLAYELEHGVHALALHTYTLSEWDEINGVVPKSPNCTGVGQ
ncbi:BolA/IbaG family iron-sulfur metabolism protein [Actinobacillus genomosp. 2]|uniref:BolA family protein n=1 Tax=Actinobacillus genomosp. 2 TaxID=230709 RepID=UPI002442D19D|nr:BolA/IbaG family iron-sulfur metabolism protein [Actinobacillus genomosp. 2]WGE32351.1 BolA/IbaG family iron-sulfur metabolism protein [Actinobacillus genomosp. 2]